jgi:hypothetical protein
MTNICVVLYGFVFVVVFLLVVVSFPFFIFFYFLFFSSFQVYDKERECLLLLLQNRILLSNLVALRERKNEIELEAKRRRLEEEAKKKGNLSVTQIQGILQNAPKSDEVDWVQEIQELKQQLTMEIRKNHVLERDLAKLDKRIGLLIRNRGELEPKKEKGTKRGKKKGEEDVRVGKKTVVFCDVTLTFFSVDRCPTFRRIPRRLRLTRSFSTFCKQSLVMLPSLCIS